MIMGMISKCSRIAVEANNYVNICCYSNFMYLYVYHVCQLVNRESRSETQCLSFMYSIINPVWSVFRIFEKWAIFKTQ